MPSFKARLPLNIKRSYFTVSLFNTNNGRYTFITKYQYVYEASEFENEGKVSYTLSTGVNEKIENEIKEISDHIKSLEQFKDFSFISPIKERSVEDVDVRFINIKMRKSIKDSDKWMFEGDVPDKETECILKVEPRLYMVNKEEKTFGIYFDLRSVTV